MQGRALPWYREQRYSEARDAVRSFQTLPSFSSKLYKPPCVDCSARV